MVRSAIPAAQGLYDPAREHDACGVAFVATLALFAWGLAWATGGLVSTILLACSPGGIAEMAITAKVMRVGVAFVTAAHVMRFAIVVLATEPTFRLLQRLARK